MKMLRNKVIDLDLAWIKSIEVFDPDIVSKASKYTDKEFLDKNVSAVWLTAAINSVDLSLLFGNETPESIGTLCHKAAFPLEDENVDKSIIKKYLTDANVKLQCAAVCVYPLRVADARTGLSNLGVDKTIPIASVAAGFPTGQYPLHTRLAEIYYAVAEGAQEIDVVIDRSLVLRGLWSQLYDELVQMRRACREATLKVILSVTECDSWTNVYKASVVAMSAGADFIKTSTGKEAKTMTIHEGLVMCEAIKEFHKRTNVMVGLKPAGGVRTTDQALSWMLMVSEVLGPKWNDPKYFRIGTSGTSSLITNLATSLADRSKQNGA